MKGRNGPSPTASGTFHGVGGPLMDPICGGRTAGATATLGPRGRGDTLSGGPVT